MQRIILADCNNFFVSCERVFNAALHNKPVVVLSNNDGCVIARSNEAKALDIPMGAAAFKYEHIFKKNNVHIYSSNFTLYADMSARVMSTLSEFSCEIEIYSIDEAFLRFPTHAYSALGAQYYTYYAQLIRARVKQYTGIPISLGIGPTKTLAKIANAIAKKNPQYHGAFDITERVDVDDILARVDVGDVWGVGYRYTKLLKSKGIATARDLKYAPDDWIRKRMTIVGYKTMLELRGIACFDLDDEPAAKKSITVSRSFGSPLSSKQHVSEAVASYMGRAAQKLREQKLAVRDITVFVATSRFHEHERYFNAISFRLPVATSFTPTLIQAVQLCVDAIFKEGLAYKKAGVILNDLVAQAEIQTSVYQVTPDTGHQKELMRVCDTITRRFGRDSLKFASCGTQQKSWQSKRSKKSPHYTTSWHELFTIKI